MIKLLKQIAAKHDHYRTQAERYQTALQVLQEELEPVMQARIAGKVGRAMAMLGPGDGADALPTAAAKNLAATITDVVSRPMTIDEVFQAVTTAGRKTTRASVQQTVNQLVSDRVFVRSKRRTGVVAPASLGLRAVRARETEIRNARQTLA